MSHERIYSKDVIDATLAFFTTSNFAVELAQYSADHAGVAVDPLVTFDVIVSPDGQTPFGVLYESATKYNIETLREVISMIDYSLDFKDQRADVDQLRTNLYAYRDAAINLIKNNPDMQGICVISELTNVKPPIVWQETGNYSGIVEINFRVQYD